MNIKQIILDDMKSNGYYIDNNEWKTSLDPRQQHRVSPNYKMHYYIQPSIDKSEIQPRLHLCKTNKDKKLFRSLLDETFSIGYTGAFGKRLRYILYDRNNPMGLLELASPVMRMKLRDDFLGINNDNRPKKVNEGLSIHRCGAIPPYNQFYASRLMAGLALSKSVIIDCLFKYNFIPQWFVTTGAFGRTPIYDRHRYKDQKASWFLGYSNGYGTISLSSDVIKKSMQYLKTEYPEFYKKSQPMPSKQMRRLSFLSSKLKIPNITKHGLSRGIYVLKGQFENEDIFKEWRKKL